MAKKKSKGKPTRSRAKGKPLGAISKRKQQRQNDALKGMLIGVAVIAVIALFFLWPVGGKTSFNHIVDWLGASEPPAQQQPDTTKSQPAQSVKPAKRPLRAANADKAPPMEKVSKSEQAGLDELIRNKTR